VSFEKQADTYSSWNQEGNKRIITILKISIQITVSQHLDLAAVSGIKVLSSKELQLLNILQQILKVHAIKTGTRKTEKIEF